MEYKKLKNSTITSHLSKAAFAGFVLTLLLCGGLFYQVSELQGKLQQLKFRQRLHEDVLTGYVEKIAELNDEISQIKNQSEIFQYDIGSPNLDDDPDYDIGNEDYTEYFVEEDNKLLNGGNFTKVGLEYNRFKREILRTTLDGVPINSESYEDVKRKNKSVEVNTRNIKNKTSQLERTVDGIRVVPQVTSTPAAFSRRSRVMHFEDKSKAFRRIVKKPLLKSGGTMGQFGSSETQDIPIRRRHRQRRVESNERSYRSRPAIHLSGDIYDSNGLAHHYADHFKNWTRDSWVKNLGMEEYFHLDDGHLQITEPGLYLIYAQVLYYDEHDTNGFGVYKNNEMILQCTTTSHTSHRVRKSNTCFTAGVSYLRDGDRLRVHDIESYRYSIFKAGKSFFGAIKLSDVRRL